ncbi:alpha/beta fold hydrolase [Alteraurantiacibacter palmitatis]|uniref:Alpha/beta fold hydrolase n=1 Tax=Alteraurantiacibacter palmitatis TaxID=2054628 RepID=A0ABV7E7V5_9SPHN
MMEQQWQDGTWQSADGLSLHYRDYPCTDPDKAVRPPILCLPGLTRNARDFEPVAAAFAGEWRVIAVDFRGRGDSDYARDTATYVPATYVADVAALLDQAGLERVVTVGTSLGGLVSVFLANAMPERIAGMVINDIGPVIEPAGLARIREYVGQGRSFPTWMHAARYLQEAGGAAFPDYTISDWLVQAKRLMALGNGGRIVLDYDMRIAEPFAAAEAAETGAPDADLWPAFRSLPAVPRLVVRGELSDILSAGTLDAMKRKIAGLQTVTVPRTGHAPTLGEAPARDAIARLLDEVE